MLSLYKLEIFALAAETGSFSKAAGRLLMSQSAVSQHMRDLEASLGAPLFCRNRRGVTLTDAGEILYRYTLQILQLVAEAESDIINVRNLTDGQINIGATPGINIYLLPGWEQEFRGRYPNITISSSTGVTNDIIEGILDNQLDIGFIEGELDQTPENLKAHILQNVSLLVVVGPRHKWYGLDSVPIEALSDQAFVMRQKNSHTRMWTEQVLREHNVIARVVAEFDNQESIKQAVISGMGITILPEYAVKAELSAGSLHVARIKDMTLLRQVKLIWNSQKPFRPVAGAFLKTLEKTFPGLRGVIEK